MESAADGRCVTGQNPERGDEWFPGVSALAALAGAGPDWISGYRRGWLIAEGDSSGWLKQELSPGEMQPDMFAAVNRADFQRGLAKGFADRKREME